MERSVTLRARFDPGSLVFACAVDSPESTQDAFLLAQSIRHFAGRFSGNPVWVFYPGNVAPGTLAGATPTAATSSLPALTGATLAQFQGLGVAVLPFEQDPSTWALPLSGKVFAAAEAESRAVGAGAEVLAWMDPDSLVLNEPGTFWLPPGKAIGYRPVDLRLIGSPAAEDPDGYWRLVYEDCDVDPAQVFEVITSADRQPIRAYFNAGLVIVRPGYGILRRWRENLRTLAADTRLEPFFIRSRLYYVFLHQVALAGAILSTVAEEETYALPVTVNYPLHLHERYPENLRPGAIDDLISMRHDVFFRKPGWEQSLPAREPLRSWLMARVSR